MKKGYPENFAMVSAWKKKKGKTSKFVVEEITNGKREREKRFNSIEWINREKWRRETKLKLLTHKNVITLIL